MTPLLCAAPRCRDPRHQPGCDQECAPHPARIAADGLRLCAWHCDRLATDAAQAAHIHAELAERLVGGSGHGEPVSGTHGHDRAPADAVVEARTLIRHTLVAITGRICDERGIGTPDMVTLPRHDGPCPVRGCPHRGVCPVHDHDQDCAPLAEFIALHAGWLAAHPAAGDCSAELGELAHGRPWRLCYPNGTRTVPIAPCPLCPGVVRALLRPADALLPSELVCDLDPEHRWPSTTWHAFRRAVKARAA